MDVFLRACVDLCVCVSVHVRVCARVCLCARVCVCACVNVHSHELCPVRRRRSVKSGSDRAAAPAFMGTTARPLFCAWERPRGRSLAHGSDRLAALSVSHCPYVFVADCWCFWGSVDVCACVQLHECSFTRTLSSTVQPFPSSQGETVRPLQRSWERHTSTDPQTHQQSAAQAQGQPETDSVAKRSLPRAREGPCGRPHAQGSGRAVIPMNAGAAARSLCDLTERLHRT